LKNREIVSRVRKIFKEVHADSTFTARLAYSILLSIAKLLIKRDSERLKIMSQANLFKKLKCVEVIDAPAIDPCCGIKSLCTVKRTKERLPKIYADTYGPLIRDVTSIDGSQTLTGIQPQEFIRIKNNPWNKKKNTNYYFYSDGYLYFPNGGFKMVEVIAFWEESISNWNKCNNETGNDCVPFLDEDFNIPGYFEANLFQMAEEQIRSTYSQIPTKQNQIDKNNNASTIQA
jgi:hypothetical protein